MNKKYYFNLANKKIWIAGHNGMVGKALFKKLADEKLNIITVDKNTLDLTKYDLEKISIHSLSP